MMGRGTRILVLAGGAAVVTGAIALWVFTGRAQPVVPPFPAGFTTFDPVLTKMIRDAVDEIAARPRDPAAWRALGQIYQANLLHKPAAQCIERAADLDPDDPRTWHALGLVKEYLGSFSEAADCFRKTASLAPDFAAGHWRLGLLLLETHELSEAEAAFTRAIAADPNDLAGRIGLARVRLQQGAAEDAVDAISRLLSEPTGNEAYLNRLLASALRRLGRHEEAAEAALRGSLGMPRWSDAWELEIARYAVLPETQLNAALAMSRQGHLAEAVAFLNRMGSHRPNDPSVPIMLGKCYHEHQRYEESEASLKRAIDLRPDSYFAHTQLSLTYLARSRSAAPAVAASLRRHALRHLDIALAANPCFAPGHGMRGEVFAADGRPDEAISAYLMAAQYDLEGVSWLTRAGRLQYQRERWHEAAETFQEVANLAPRDVEALHLLGRCLLRLGRPADAEARLREAMQLAPDNESVRTSLQELAARTGAPNGARR